MFLNLFNGNRSLPSNRTDHAAKTKSSRLFRNRDAVFPLNPKDSADAPPEGSLLQWIDEYFDRYALPGPGWIWRLSASALRCYIVATTASLCGYDSIGFEHQRESTGISAVFR